MLPKAKAIGSRDNKVVTERYAQQLAGGNQLLREYDILLTGCNLSRRMIVRDNDACRTIDNSIGKYFSWVCNHGIECPSRYGSLCNKTLASIEAKADTVFLHSSSYVRESSQKVLLSPEWFDAAYEVSLGELQRGN